MELFWNDKGAINNKKMEGRYWEKDIKKFIIGKGGGEKIFV